MSQRRGPKSRLDVLLVERGLAESRTRAQALVMARLVEVDGVTIDKAGTTVGVDAQVVVRPSGPTYVSRGGENWRARSWPLHRMDWSSLMP